MPDEPRLKEKTGSSCNGQSGYYIVWDRVRWAKITGLALGFLISVFIHENQFLKSRADAVEQSASSPPPTAPTTASDNPAILQKNFKRLSWNRLPARGFLSASLLGLPLNPLTPIFRPCHSLLSSAHRKLSSPCISSITGTL